MINNKQQVFNEDWFAVPYVMVTCQVRLNYSLSIYSSSNVQSLLVISSNHPSTPAIWLKLTWSGKRSFRRSWLGCLQLRLAWVKTEENKSMCLSIAIQNKKVNHPSFFQHQRQSATIAQVSRLAISLLTETSQETFIMLPSLIRPELGQLKYRVI